MTEFSLFEAYALTILENLPSFFNHVVQGFFKVKLMEAHKSSSDEHIFSVTFEASLLKASISIVDIFFKFLNAEQLESLITAVCTCKAASNTIIADMIDTNPVSTILSTISSEAKSHKKLTVHATFNAYHEVVTKAIDKPIFEK